MPSHHGFGQAAWVVCAVLGTVGCSTQTTESTCDPAIVHSISLTIRDSTSMAPVAAGATIIVRGTHDSGVSTDTVLVADTPHSLPSADFGAGAGVYDLRIRQPGYADWVKTGVTVVAVGDCDFEPVSLTALLQLRAR